MQKQTYISPEFLKIMVVEQDVICTSIDNYDNIGEDNN